MNSGFLCHTIIWPWEEADWHELNAFFAKNAPPDVKKKVKTVAAKRNWLTNATQLNSRIESSFRFQFPMSCELCSEQNLRRHLYKRVR